MYSINSQLENNIFLWHKKGFKEYNVKIILAHASKKGVMVYYHSLLSISLSLGISTK